MSLKNLVLEVCDLMNTISAVAEDGKFEFWRESLKFVPHLLDIPDIARYAKEAGAELAAQIYKDPAWAAGVIEAAKQRLKLSSEVSEVIAEVSISVTIHLFAGVLTIKDVVKKAKEK